VVTIANPCIRDTITIDAEFNARVGTFAGPGSLYVLARVVDQQTELRVGAHPVVIVADEFRGNGQLINANGVSSSSPGSAGANGAPNPGGQDGRPGENGGPGGAGTSAGTVTVMCRRSSGVRISANGGAGAAGGPGGNGGNGANATSIPGGSHTEVQIGPDGESIEVTVTDPPIEIPGTLGGGGGLGGDGGAGGNAGTIGFTSIIDDTPPVLEAIAGPGGPGGPGGVAGPHGAFVEVPPDLDFTPVPGQTGASGAEGSISVTTLPEADYVAGLRPLLDREGPSYANFWAPFRIVMGQYFYRQLRKSDPEKGQLAATEFDRALELQPDNVNAQRWRSQLRDVPQPTSLGPGLEWQPGGINALGLRRDLDVLPRFDAYRDAFTAFGSLVLDFLNQGAAVITQAPDLEIWEDFLEQQRRQAQAAHQSSLEDQGLADTEARLAGDALAGVQSQLDRTTADIQTALAEMQEEEVSFGDIVGTVAGIAGAVVAVVAAIPSAGASLVALVPSMVALSSAVIDNAEPVAKALMAGDEVETEKVKKAYDKAEKKAADVVKGAKAVVDFVKVVQKLNAATTPDNSKHLALVRHGVELTHELLLARHRVTLAEQRVEVAGARVGRATDAVSGVAAVESGLALVHDKVTSTGLNAISIAESKADALLTLAFHAQRSVEIYTLIDQEDKVRLETGHLHPDRSLDYSEGVIDEFKLVQLLQDSWEGLTGLLQMQLEFDGFTNQFIDKDWRRLSFRADGPEVERLRSTGRFDFRIDAASLPTAQKQAKARAVRIALVDAIHPAGACTCEIRHGSTYETRHSDGTITATVLQPRSSTREAKLERLAADEGIGPDPLLTEPQSLSFWGRGLGGDYELSIPDHELKVLDLSALTEVQVWVGYTFLR
jgi:hypothetical protein